MIINLIFEYLTPAMYWIKYVDSFNLDKTHKALAVVLIFTHWWFKDLEKIIKPLGKTQCLCSGFQDVFAPPSSHLVLINTLCHLPCNLSSSHALVSFFLSLHLNNWQKHLKAGRVCCSLPAWRMLSLMPGRTLRGKQEAAGHCFHITSTVRSLRAILAGTQLYSSF